MEGVMYSSIHSTGDTALEDLSLAEKMVFRLVTGKSDNGNFAVCANLSVVDPLLRLSYRCLVPRTGFMQSLVDGVMYTNPPTDSMDYDDAYIEAKRLFVAMFGEGEEFLVRDEMEDVETEEELN